MTSPNRAIEIIDTDLDHMLRRPGMYVGAHSPECHHCFFVLLLSLLSVREQILEVDVDFRKIYHHLLVEMTGRGSGNLGPNSRLRDFYGENSFSSSDPNYGNVMLFWREFVERARATMDPKAE